MEPMKPMKPMEPMDFGPPWWPAALGQPSTSGAQDGIRYAFFPERSRLLVEREGKLTTYDTGGRRIDGVSQTSGNSGVPVFASGGDKLKLDALRRVDS